MNSLIIIPLKEKLLFFCISYKCGRKIVYEDSIYYRSVGIKIGIEKVLSIISSQNIQLKYTVIRAQYGGTIFKTPEYANTRTIEKLKKIEHEAPLHISPVIECTRVLNEKLKIPLIIVFETSFFANLPDYESYYAIPEPLVNHINKKRFGYHGIFHQESIKKTICNKDVKVISICLEPRMEVVASVSGNPILTTGGATPLEGLPGETSSGSIDPTIIITLNRDFGYTPEEINDILTNKSGFLGITGRSIKLPDILGGKSIDKDILFLREFIKYRILMACGSCIAAMNGVDTIIFSGRYFFLDKYLERFLKEKILLFNNKEIRYDTISTFLPEILSDIGKKYY